MRSHSQRSGGDRHMYASRTRFIPPGILHRFERCKWPLAAEEVEGPEIARARRHWWARAADVEVIGAARARAYRIHL